MHYPLAGELWQAKASGAKVLVRYTSGRTVTLYGVESGQTFQIRLGWFRKRYERAEASPGEKND